MKKREASIIEMSRVELNLKFKKFLKDKCGYSDVLSTIINNNGDDGAVIEVEMGEFTEEQEEKMSTFNIYLATICAPALGMDLFYSIFGMESELIKTDDGVKIIQYK